MKWKVGDRAIYLDGVGIRWSVTIKQVGRNELRAVTDDGRDVRDAKIYFERSGTDAAAKDKPS